MSASEVSPNPFWYAKLTAALTSRDRLSICVLAMFVHKSVDQLSMSRVGKPVKPPACQQAVAGVGADARSPGPAPTNLWHEFRWPGYAARSDEQVLNRVGTVPRRGVDLRFGGGLRASGGWLGFGRHR